MPSNNIGALLFAEQAGVEFEMTTTPDGINGGINYATYTPDLDAMEATLKEKGLLKTMLTRLDAAGNPREGEPEIVSVFEAMRRAVFEEIATDRHFIKSSTAEAQRLIKEYENLQKSLEAAKKLIEDQYELSDTTLTQLNTQSIDVAEAIRAFVSSRELVVNEIREILEAAVSPIIFKNLYSGATTLSQVHFFLRAQLDRLSEIESKGELRPSGDVLRIMLAVDFEPYEERTRNLYNYNPLVHYKAIAEILRKELGQQARLDKYLINQRVEELEDSFTDRLTHSNPMVGSWVGGYYALTLIRGGESNGDYIDLEIAQRVLEAYGKSEFGQIAASYQPARTADAEAGTGHVSVSIDNPASCESEMLEQIEKMVEEIQDQYRVEKDLEDLRFYSMY